MKNTNTTSFRKTLAWAAAGVGVMLVAHAIVREVTKFRLEGKVVLIAGGSGGLGPVIARALATRGAKLAICSRSADNLELARQELERMGASVLAIPGDFSDHDVVKAMIHDVIDHYGRLDIIINNNGIISEAMQTVLKKNNIKVKTVAPNVLTQPDELTAQNIIKEIAYGETEPLLSLSGKLAMVVKAVAPGWMSVMLSLANNFLPDTIAGNHTAKTGFGSTSKLSESPRPMLAEKATANNNEM